MYKKLICIILFLLISVLNIYADLIIDDFEQNNGNTNTLGYWADGSTDGQYWFGADVNWAAKNGTNGGHFVCSNYNTYAVFFDLIKDDPPPYRDLSDNYNYYKLSFWIKQVPEPKYPGPMKINKVKLEKTDYHTNGWVKFSDYNGGNSEVSTNWTEIVIPMSDFTNNTENGFTLSSVKNFVIDITNGVIGAFYIDDIKIVSGVEITTTDSSNITTGETNENYAVGSIVQIRITERSNKPSCNGIITIKPTADSGVSSQPMVNAGGGVYTYNWDTTGKTVTSYTVECILYNTYATDYNGSNDTGPDLIITLTPGGPPTTPTGLTIWNNYITEENQYIKIFIKSPAPEKYADENISVKVYTLNGVLVKEIINTPYKQISNPIIWDCEVNGEKLQNGVYIIMIKGAGIDEYKRIYIAK